MNRGLKGKQAQYFCTIIFLGIYLKCFKLDYMRYKICENYPLGVWIGYKIRGLLWRLCGWPNFMRFFHIWFFYVSVFNSSFFHARKYKFMDVLICSINFRRKEGSFALNKIDKCVSVENFTFFLELQDQYGGIF